MTVGKVTDITRRERAGCTWATASTTRVANNCSWGLNLYLPISRTDTPIYVGHARDLADRTKNHTASCDAGWGLAAKDFELVTIPMSSRLRKYAEDLLIEQFDPLWNRTWLSGFGSRDQGELRSSSQRPTAFDRLHPGRPWATTVRRDQRLARRVRETLAEEHSGDLAA